MFIDYRPVSKKRSRLDMLVQRCTAFRSWKEMVKAMKGGYVPTLSGGKQHSKLRDVIRRNGFRAFRKCVLI